MTAKPLVIFDIDGTLANTVKVDDICYTKTVKTLYGVDFGEIDWSKYQDVTDWGVLKSIFANELNRDLSRNELERARQYFCGLLEKYSKDNPEYFTEIPGALEFVQSLKTLRFPLAIATGGWGESARLKLDRIGLDYRKIPFADSNHHFSRNEIVTEAISLARVKHKSGFTKVIYFGDGEWDLLTCRLLGIDFIGIDAANNGKLKDLGSEAVFKNFLDKKLLIETLVS